MIDVIDPRAGGVDDDVRPDLIERERTPVDEAHAPTLESVRREIIDCARPRVRLEAVVDEFKAEPFRLRHAGVVIGGNRNDGGIDARKRAPDAAANLDAMERRHAAPDAEEIVKDHAQFDDEESAISQIRVAAEEAANRRQNAAEIAADRDDARKGVHVVWRVLQKQIAFMDRFRYQAELARLQIFQAAVDQPRRGRARCSAPVALVDQQAVHALKREVAEHAGAIDPPANDENLSTRIALQLLERGFAIRVRGLEAHS